MRRGGGAEGAGPPPGPAHRLLDAAVSAESRQQITQLLSQIDALNGAEKLLLYLKLPTGPPPMDPLKQPVNPLGSRAEIHQTVMWIQTHLEVDPEISLPKQHVYEEYLEYCTSTKMKPLSTADFGKVMKQVYPCVKPRRLGTRGNSRYCYAGMRKRIKLEVPQLPDLWEKPKNNEIPTPPNDLLGAASQLIREWAEKVLGFTFGNLCELAHHLVEKKIVDSSSSSAHTFMSSLPESIENCETSADKDDAFLDSSQNSKESYHIPKNKKIEKGVIKRLKRKIQPQNINTNNPVPVNNNTLHESEELATSSIIDRSQQTCTTVSSSDFPVKQESDILTPEYNRVPQPIQYSVDKCKDYLQPRDPDLLTNEPASQALRAFSAGQSRDFHNVAVNLAQVYNPPSRYSPQVMGVVKNIALPSRNYGYNQPYKFDPYSQEEFHQPTNLSLNNYANHNSENPAMSHISLPHSNLPINLSNSSDANDNDSKIFNESHSIKSENDSLNLSTTDRRNNWHSEHIPVPTPPRKLPLPGKKMILETYNNENQLTIKSSMASPCKMESFNHGEYLPKKMRATENFSGKLAAARLLNNPYLGVGVNDATEKFNKTIINSTASEYMSAAIKTSQISDSIGNLSNNSMMDSIKPANDNYISASSFTNLPVVEENAYAKSNADLLSPKKTQRNSKVKKAPKLKSPDSTNANDVDRPVEKVVTRGRPRKKSLTKAKYTRRQVKTKIVNPNGQCDHTKYPKRSSDSCCSLTETINIKTGIICRENHSEILNRERVSSICNMDKHALDGYLNESNSQEHEEEIMKYFPNNSDSQSNDANIDTNHSSNDESELSLMKNEESASTNIVTNSNQKDYDNPLGIEVQSNSDDKNDYLDTNDDHSQGKSYKISQLRELLAKNFSQNSSMSSLPFANDNRDGESMNMNKPFLHPINGIDSAFTSISRRNTTASSHAIDSNTGLTQIVLPKRQPNITDRPSAIQSAILNTGLNARRRVSFEKPLTENTDAVSYGNQDLINKDYQNIPKSPTARMQHFSFVPISPGPHSPVNLNKHVTGSKIIDSPKKNVGNSLICTSPVSLSSSASPFVSPRITPVPRARNASIANSASSKVQFKKLSRLIVNKALYGDNMHHHSPNMIKNSPHEAGNFIIPNEQSAIPRSPNFTTKSRNFAMSAPPSPNILTSKYKMNFGMQNQNVISANPQSVIQILPSNQSHYANNEMMGVQTPDSTQSDQSQPLSADPLSHEVSQFFSDSNMSLDEANNSLRSQSVPLHQNNPVTESGLTYFGQDRTENPGSANVNFLSYNNTPCSSIPPTPIPREFCDFGNLTDTCDSISKVGLNSENLDKIYNVLDSNQTLVGNVDKRNVMLNPVTDALPDFSQDISNNNNIVEPLLNQTNKPFQFQPLLFCEQPFSESGTYWEKARNIIVPRENKFITSRSVPSTPLPGGNLNHPDFNLGKTQIIIPQQYQSEYDNQSCGKILTSKSVPSTPHSADDRNVFSYSNRDFLINGNSVDPNISSSFDDKKAHNTPIDQGFLEESTNLLEVKGNSSVLAGLANSPLPGAIDIVNNELSTFNDESMDLPFAEQDMPVNVNFHSCIESGNDFLDLGMM